MSQVDDWSDGYTSDYLRDLNTYGPASANVPRSSVVSHQVRYRAPDTSDIPLAPGQNPEDSVYSNASGARMGQLKSRSGYNPPAGGGYTAQTYPSSGTGAKRYARPKPAVKKKTQSTSKQQTQSASKQQPQPEYRTGGARTSEENELTRSAAEHRTGADLGQLSSQAFDAAAHFLPALKLLGFGAGAGSADTASTDIQQDDIDRAYDWTATGNAGTGGFSPERPMIDSSDAASGIPPEIMARLKKDADDGSPWGLLPWALGPIYKPIAGLLPAGQKIAGLLPAGQKLLPAGQKLLPYNGEAAAGAVGSKAGEAAAGAGNKSSFGFDLSAEDVAAANAANAAAKQQAVNLSEMRSTLIRAGMPDREIEAYMRGAGFYNDPEALRQAIDVVRKYGIAGLFEHSAARAGSAAGANGAAGAAGRTAADGGVSELANAGNVGRETAAGAATGSVSEGVDSASQQLIQHIRSGTLDEMERAWIEATAAGAAKAPGTIDASTQAILNEARAAGILGRDAAGTAGTGAGSAAGTGSRGSFRFDLSPEEIASAKASHDAYVRGTAGSGAGHVDLERAYLDALNNARGTTTGRAAADGGVSELANAANAGRGAAGADAATGAAGTAGSGAIDSTTRFLIKQIKTGKLDDLERAWINALADKGVRNPQSLSASEQALVDNARAAGILDDAAAGAARGAPQGTVAGAGSKARWDEIPDANGMTRSRADEVLAREEIRRYDPRTTREGIARYIEDDLKTLAGKPGYETPYQAFQTLMSQWGKYNPDLGQDPYNYIWRLAVRMFE